MAKTIVSLYDDFATAQQVAQELVDAGFSRDNISVMANDAAGEYGSQFGPSEFEATSDTAGCARGELCTDLRRILLTAPIVPRRLMPSTADRVSRTTRAR